MIDFSCDEGSQFHETPDYVKNQKADLVPLKLNPIPKPPKYTPCPWAKKLKKKEKSEIKYDPINVGDISSLNNSKLVNDDIIYNNSKIEKTDPGRIEVDEKKTIRDIDGKIKIVHVIKKKNKGSFDRGDYLARMKVGQNARDNARLMEEKEFDRSRIENRPRINLDPYSGRQDINYTANSSNTNMNSFGSYERYQEDKTRERDDYRSRRDSRNYNDSSRPGSSKDSYYSGSHRDRSPDRRRNRSPDRYRR